MTVTPPPWAVLAWIDDTAIYLELPKTDGTFYRQTFPLSEAGLSKALNSLRTRTGVHPGPAAPIHEDRFSPSLRAAVNKIILGF